MNLLKGELRQVGESLAFVNGSATFPLSGPIPGEGAPGQVTIGLRPEHFERAPATPGAGTVSGVVTLLEPLGSDLFVTIDTPDGEVTGRLDPHTHVAVGHRIGLRPDLSQAHLFATETGERVPAGDRP